jgi:hypothetical protein
VKGEEASKQVTSGRLQYSSPPRLLASSPPRLLASRRWIYLQPLLEVGLDLFTPCAVDLAGRVLAFVQAKLAEGIAHTDVLRFFDDFLDQVGWNEDDAGGRA